MLISELMEKTDVTRDTIRHYEHIGLLHESHFTRRANGYRDYNDAAVDRITLVKKAQRAGFTLNQVASVADDWESNVLTEDEKRQIFIKQLDTIDARIADLQDIKAEIQTMLAKNFQWDHQAEASS